MLSLKSHETLQPELKHKADNGSNNTDSIITHSNKNNPQHSLGMHCILKVFTRLLR